MRKRWLTLFAALAFVIPLHCAQADEFAPDRFKGGTSDGFASAGIYRDASVIAALVRFLGGNGDGYVAFAVSGLRVPPRGTMISVF
jgi:hypothetical protein